MSGDVRRVRTWQELEDWFTGAAEGRAVFYSPDTGPGWDDLWLRLGDEPELGRGVRSFSLSPDDLRWLHAVLARYLGRKEEG